MNKAKLHLLLINFAVWAIPTEALFALRRPEKPESTERIPAPSARLRLKLRGGNRAAVASGEGELPGKINYFVGEDPTHWHLGVSAFGRVHYGEAYPGIDLVYYGNQRQLIS